jgi:methanogenic corrinoid protein MtbC1
MDLGHRPGRLMSTSVEELEALAATSHATKAAVADAGSHELNELSALIQRHDGPAYLQAMQQRLARQGLFRFVQDTVAPLTVQIGLAWERGRMQVFEEHLFTELTARVLRQAIAAVPGGTEPRVLLTTLPKEPHEIGLLMVEALLSLEGAQCISLGTEMPLMEIVDAVAAHQVDVVALSFSAAFPARQTRALLEQLRSVLSATTELWAGGAGVRNLAAPAGVMCMASLDSAVAAVNRWRLRAT